MQQQQQQIFSTYLTQKQPNLHLGHLLSQTRFLPVTKRNTSKRFHSLTSVRSQPPLRIKLLSILKMFLPQTGQVRCYQYVSALGNHVIMHNYVFCEQTAQHRHRRFQSEAFFNASVQVSHLRYFVFGVFPDVRFDLFVQYALYAGKSGQVVK